MPIETINAGIALAGAAGAGFVAGLFFNDRFMLAQRGTKEFIHRTWGRVMIITCHPHDGACLIIERMETTDPEDDDLVLDTCERSDLTDTDLQDQWPYLGFTMKTKAQ